MTFHASSMRGIISQRQLKRIDFIRSLQETYGERARHRQDRVGMAPPGCCWYHLEAPMDESAHIVKRLALSSGCPCDLSGGSFLALWNLLERFLYGSSNCFWESMKTKSVVV
jgi:hypothetical protein